MCKLQEDLSVFEQLAMNNFVNILWLEAFRNCYFNMYNHIYYVYKIAFTGTTVFVNVVVLRDYKKKKGHKMGIV